MPVRCIEDIVANKRMTNVRVRADYPDPETLIGPLLQLFTRFAQRHDPSLAGDLQSRLLALASHPTVNIELRLVAGAIAFEPADWVVLQ